MQNKSCLWVVTTVLTYLSDIKTLQDLFPVFVQSVTDLTSHSEVSANSTT